MYYEEYGPVIYKQLDAANLYLENMYNELLSFYLDDAAVFGLTKMKQVGRICNVYRL